MTKAFIQDLLKQGEGLQIEFKESFAELNRDAFESICAFLNRKGGHLLLGVTNARIVEGVLDAEKLKQTVISEANNPQKLNPVFPLSPEIVDMDGEDVICIYIPESSLVHSTAGKTFDRRGESDLDISRQPGSITELHLRKQGSFTENRIYPYLALSDLRTDLIDRARRLARGQRPDHPWLEMSNEELLRSAGLFQKDYATGGEGYTLAAALLFGKDEVIQSIVPYYKTDALYRVQNLDRYDDRDDIRTNLIEAYDRLMAFIAKHLPDKFFQEPDATRVSIRDKIFREVVANMLVHREYASPYHARLVIERDKVTAENWNKPRYHSPLRPDTFSPFTKNPVLTRFFKEIGRMDELGSGVRNLFRYGPAYASGRMPEVIEEDIFRAVIPWDEGKIEGKIEGKNGGATGKEWELTVSEALAQQPMRAATRERLISLLKIVERSPGINKVGLAGYMGLTENKVQSALSPAISLRLLEYRGSA
jgi:ATP-dependent DNA helicase RecG